MNNHDLTALAEAVGVIDPDPTPWGHADTLGLTLGIIIGYPTLVAIMSLAGAA